MPEFKIVNNDQMHYYTHYVEAPDREAAMRRFKVSHYGSMVSCDEIKPEIICPHCNKDINNIKQKS